MKYLIILCLTLVGFSLSAQDTIPQDPSALEVIDYIGNKAADAITSMASALEVPATHVYKTVVRQQTMTAITYLLLGIIGIILLYFANRYWVKGQEIDEASDSYQSESTYQHIVGMVFTLGGIVCCIISIMCVNQIVSGLFNPEYGAINEIISWIK